MKKLITILSLFLLLGCSANPNAKVEESNTPAKIYKIDTFQWIYLIEIDKCEYLVYNGAKQGGIIHKQNCKNH